MPEQDKTYRRGSYKPDKHSALPFVDKQYKELVDRLAEKNGRTKKRQTEISIENDAIREGIVNDKGIKE